MMTVLLGYTNPFGINLLSVFYKIPSQALPIVLTLCLVLLATYYA